MSVFVTKVNAMETKQVNPTITWDEKKKWLKERFPAITDSDLQFNDGKEKLMIEMLAYKLGKPADELRYIIHEIQKAF